MKHKRNKRTLQTINVTQKSELKGGARAKGGMTVQDRSLASEAKTKPRAS